MYCEPNNSAEHRASNIRQLPIAALKPFERNARTHSVRQIKQIEASIREFGFLNPILIDSDNVIIAGHGRVAAAKNIGMLTVPTILIDHLSDEQRRAYIIADNRLAELAGWDPAILRVEFQFLEVDLDFNIEVTGFSTAEIDLILDGADERKTDPEADAIFVPQTNPVTQPGDIWELGPHRLLCGDARSSDDFAALMRGDSARVVFTDPPYNVKIDGHVCGNGRIKHREFVMAAGEMSESEFTAFLTDTLRNLAAASCDGAIHYVCMDWRHMNEVLHAGSAAYAELKNLIVWAKDNGGMGSFYRSQHELIFVFKNGAAPHLNNFGLGEHGRYRTNVWRYPGVNTLKASRDEELAMHPTVKPVCLIADAIRDVSKRGDIVLDCFGGSGSTLIAAHKTSRRARLMELDPIYCDVIVCRFQEFAKLPARHVDTGKSFDEVRQDLKPTEE